MIVKSVIENNRMRETDLWKGGREGKRILTEEYLSSRILSDQWNCKRSKLSVPILRRLLSIAAGAIVLVISSGRGTHFVKNCDNQNRS